MSYFMSLSRINDLIAVPKIIWIKKIKNNNLP